jgi:hypothetical protein
MTIIEARYVGPAKVPEWGTWFEWKKYDADFWANKAFPILRKQFQGLYEFRMVKP